MQPRASTLTVALRCLAGQLAEAAEAGGAAAAEKVLHRAELSGLALAAAPQQPGGGQPPVAPLPPLGPAVLEALLAVYAAAADAGVHHSAEVAALAAAAAQQGQVLTPGSSLALLTCWEAAEGGAGSGGGASAQPAARALRPLLEQLFGEEAVAEVETAAYADAEARLPSPACTVEEALAAVATAAGAATAAWELQGLQQVEPAGEEEQQPRAASNRLSADVLAALRRGKLSAGVLAACRSLDQSSLLEELSALEKRGRVRPLVAFSCSKSNQLRLFSGLPAPTAPLWFAAGRALFNFLLSSHAPPPGCSSQSWRRLWGWAAAGSTRATRTCGRS